ncbi:cytidylate kinase [Carnobacterium iners]|uniref:Cytidylate kinase n=1 Tax=Carnobacterium iners TaxID=1073423 RepID=A0A1X7NCX4_9LACT|nr:(d)CMP kinase [Carnobacterium iners]SEK36180.1 cytidylate kinase [Carnobacterium iners]SMH35491.1 cytidylate kinase [Carnobacterium iners]
MTNKMMIAIDGPASAGKSTVAKLLANELGYIYCDTGAMYRALTYEALQKGINLEDEEALIILLEKNAISFEPTEKNQKVYLNNKEVTEAIRQPDVTNSVSAVAAHSQVRKELVKRQQKIADKGGVVMDGRDIGTTVLPHAEVKIFLIASVEERAERRYKENKLNGIDTPLEQLKKEISDRDYKDSHRESSPLTKAEDAVLLDTTSLDIQQVIGKIKEVVSSRIS